MNGTDSVTAEMPLLETPTSRGSTIHAASPLQADRVRPVLNTRLAPIGIAAAIVAISVLHYVTAIHSVVLHEIFKRLYYVPIVVGAVGYGLKGGLATSVFASLLYLPHVILHWHGWSVSLVEQYGEIILFNVVAASTGVLADRLRAERNRYWHAATELQDAYGRLKAQMEERLRVDRLVTIGRIASGMAHEIRNPLGGVLGCLEILEADFPTAHPKREFFTRARRETRRLDAVVSEFLEFAEPAPPSSCTIDLNATVESAARLARPGLSGGGVTLRSQTSPAPRLASGDAEQVQRALLNLILAGSSELRGTGIDVDVIQSSPPTVAILIHEAQSGIAIGDMFDPFPPLWRGRGLALATARRLVENQRGTLRAERLDDGLRFVMTLPVPSPSLALTAPDRAAGGAP